MHDDPMLGNTHAQSRRRHPLRTAWRWGWRFVWNSLAVVGLLSIVYMLCFNLSVVVSGSMSPTLQGDGSPGSDWMLCERVTYWFREPRRWEVVQIETDDHMQIAKRVVGLPHDRIAIRDHHVVVGDSQATFPTSLRDLVYYAEGNTSDGREVPCKRGYYVLGDDSIDSYDSRYVGPVSREAIQGRAWLIVWPPSRMGWVNNG
jgi:signal peptidase I